jgi:hypothetical protein
MALQSSGAISLSQIQSEWGGSNPISLSEYYRNSLPSGRTNYGSIPTSGAISMSNFYGTNAASANWTATVTIGAFTAGKISVFGYNAGTYGSISDTTINTFGNRTITAVFWNGTSAGIVIPGAPNSGWTRFIIHSTSFYRTQATNFNSSTGQFLWTTTTNPFAAISGTRTVQMII